jgi:hypothetical protein
MSKKIASLSSFPSSLLDSEDEVNPPTDNAKRPLALSYSMVAFNLPSRTGWLQKKSPKFFIGWQWRYFELKDKKLYYFKNTVGRKPKGVINFDLVHVEVVDVKGSNEFVIAPVGSKRKFRIRAESVKVKRAWLNEIEDHLLLSEGRSRRPDRIVNMKEWWRTDRISELQFMNAADTGDILLFRSLDATSKLQRVVLSSKYDHVALVIRYSNGELALLESTSMDGVSIVRWQDFMVYRWHLLYQWIVFRHLETTRDEEMVLRLQDFICKVKGMQYLINPISLIQRRDPTGPDQGFFCSQLVASAYKAIDVLHPAVASVSVLPGHFSYEADLQMIGSSFLGEEQLIDFELDA